MPQGTPFCSDGMTMPSCYGMLAGMRAHRKNFHIPLEAELHERLRRESIRSGKPATDFAREAIESALAERSRMALHEEIAQYATAMAGSGADLDPDLERAAVERLSADRPVTRDGSRSEQAPPRAAKAPASRRGRRRLRS
jgi:predicted DNA-binding protein